MNTSKGQMLLGAEEKQKWDLIIGDTKLPWGQEASPTAKVTFWEVQHVISTDIHLRHWVSSENQQDTDMVIEFLTQTSQ